MASLIDLPDAYVRLVAAQREVTEVEAKEIEAQATRESRRSKFNRRYPKVY